MYRIVSLSVLLTLIVILGVTFFRVLAPFMLPLFLAGVTAIISQPVFNYFLRRTGSRASWAAGLTTATVMGVILIPIVLGILLLTLQLYTYAATLSDGDEWAKFFNTVRTSAQEKTTSAFDWGVEQLNQFLPPERQRDPREVQEQVQQEIERYITGLGDKSLGIAGTTFNVLTGTLIGVASALMSLAIYAIALFFFLADGTKMLASAEKMIPVQIDYQRELVMQFSRVVRSVVMSTFLAALAQGLAVTAALAFFGFEHFFMLFVLSTVAALVPMVGTWPIWFPCAISLFLGGHPVQAVLLILWGLLVVATLDNVIRVWILNTETKLHPLLGFLSVIGGLQVIGLWGIIIGPVIASCLHGLITIFNHELVELSRQKFGQAAEEKADGEVAAEATGTPLPPAKEAAPLSDVVRSAEKSPPRQNQQQPSSKRKGRKRR